MNSRHPSNMNDEQPTGESAVSRRQFLKLTGAAGASVLAAGGMAAVLAACGGEEVTTTAAAPATTTTTAPPATSTRMSYQWFVSMHPGFGSTELSSRLTAFWVLFQPPMFHQTRFSSSLMWKRIRKPSSPASFRALSSSV